MRDPDPTRLLPNPRHLQAALEVARRGSLSAAARAVHLSQPALSQAVTALERHFGASLFRRSGSGARPTDAGRLCCDRIERALQQLREGLDELRRGTGREAGSRRDAARFASAARLKALVAVVEGGSLGAAARSSGTSAPGLHRAMRQLERSLGVALFERTSFGVRPTREAERLARRVRLAAAELAQAQAELDALRGGGAGRTIIGAMPLARSVVLPRTLARFSAEHPGHGLTVLEGSYENLIAALRNGGADLVIGALRDPLPHADLRQEWLFDDPLAIVVRSGHPLAAGRRAPSMRQLAEYPWVAPRAGSPLRGQFEELFRAAGLRAPPDAIECGSLVVARGLLVEGDRVMLLSAHQIHFELRAGLLQALPLPGRRIQTRAIGLTVRLDWRPTAAQARLLEVLRVQSAALAAGPFQRPAARSLNVLGATPSARVKKRVK